jgi:Rps23 Pro-64 3,4-dihydroxylase Tpa1-like proline 4-hydroxylase
MIDFLKLKDNIELYKDKFANALPYHDGWLHQVGKGSYLNMMHADFNFHPQKPSRFRNVNMLLYLNSEWKAEYCGKIKLKNVNDHDKKSYKIEPLFNRAVVMFTREHTLHDYDEIKFSDGKYRRSIAAYSCTKKSFDGDVRTTIWYPEDGGIVKRVLGKHMPKLVKFKSMIFGSGTTKNK